MSKVVVVGFDASVDTDFFVLDALSSELFASELDELAIDLVEACMSPFNMHLAPERGDAMDAIVPGVELVVALNISGVSKIPGGRAPKREGLTYDRKNGLMLDKCLRVGAMFACFGAEQPWYGKIPFTKRELAYSGSNLYLYKEAR